VGYRWARRAGAPRRPPRRRTGPVLGERFSGWGATLFLHPDRARPAISPGQTGPGGKGKESANRVGRGSDPARLAEPPHRGQTCGRNWKGRLVADDAWRADQGTRRPRAKKAAPGPFAVRRWPRSVRVGGRVVPRFLPRNFPLGRKSRVLPGPPLPQPISVPRFLAEARSAKRTCLGRRRFTWSRLSGGVPCLCRWALGFGGWTAASPKEKKKKPHPFAGRKNAKARTRKFVKSKQAKKERGQKKRDGGKTSKGKPSPHAASQAEN